jgi:hypothetical protein
MHIGLSLALTRLSRTGGGAPPSPFDPDALAYITAVETADGQALEDGVKTAINDFVVGCKADGIWAAIKASCILAGARTLAGALVPLAGAAPTNFNFVAGDYNRKTGLKGDRATKTLNTNRADNAQPQNSFHCAVHITQYVPGGDALSSGADPGNSLVAISSTSRRLITRSRTQTNFQIDTSVDFLGIVGHSRGSASSYNARVGQQTFSDNTSSQTPTSTTQKVFSRDGSSQFNECRIAFYSVGENLNLAQLENRTAALMTAIDGAIP